MNPVRAGMVEHPSDYPWSSNACHAIGKAESMLSPHDLYLQLGDSDDARQENYRALFDAQLERRELDTIRHATNKSWVLGPYVKELKKHESMENLSEPLK